MSTAAVKVCGICELPCEGFVGNPGGVRAGRGLDHEQCYRELLEGLGKQQHIALVAREHALQASRMAALKDGRLHPDDEALLDAQAWTQPHGHRHCDRCKGAHPTILIGTPEAGSGAGGDIRHCRACVAILLILARVQAEDHGSGRTYTPRLPRVG